MSNQPKSKIVRLSAHDEVQNPKSKISPLPQANWQEYLLWLCRQRRAFKVVEASMRPTLNPGDKVFSVPIRDASKSRDLKRGDIVIAYHPSKPELRLIKRVQDVFYDGGCYLISDNTAEPTARDSGSFGIVGRDLIVGRVTSVFYRAP
ncbi:MAG: nickel-type superoxide dismutase maturation protease [Cyanobacteria bacterium J06635_1]